MTILGLLIIGIQRASRIGSFVLLMMCAAPLHAAEPASSFERTLSAGIEGGAGLTAPSVGPLNRLLVADGFAPKSGP